VNTYLKISWSISDADKCSFGVLGRVKVSKWNCGEREEETCGKLILNHVSSKMRKKAASTQTQLRNSIHNSLLVSCVERQSYPNRNWKSQQTNSVKIIILIYFFTLFLSPSQSRKNKKKSESHIHHWSRFALHFILFFEPSFSIISQHLMYNFHN